MRKTLSSLGIGLVLLVCVSTLAFAQTEEFRMNLKRNFGYSSGNQVRGSFTADIVNPADPGLKNVKSVTYQIDGQIMQKVDASPFSYTFNTQQFPTGLHKLNAVVETSDGRKVSTVNREFEFATPDQETSSVVKIVGPILGLILVVGAGGIAAQFLFFKNRPKVHLELGAPRNYGILGGGVCPRCHRPYPLHWWAINAGLGTKFDRCDFCGKWALVRRLSKSELATAEANEKQMAQPTVPIAEKSEDERLRDMIDNSRYTS